jgi:PhnB protein
MAITALNPYINFDGTAEAAIKHYEKILGAEVEGKILRFADLPEAPGMPACAPELRQRVMHAQLKLGGGTLMLSDTMSPGSGAPGGQVQVTLHFDDPADLTAKFEALSQGGTVRMPVGDAFWGAKFGMLTDAYGVEWMFNCDLKPQG